MLSEVKPGFLFVRCCQVLGSAQQAGLALFTNPALEHRLDEDLTVALDQIFDLLVASFRSQHFRCWKVNVF